MLTKATRQASRRPERPETHHRYGIRHFGAGQIHGQLLLQMVVSETKQNKTKNYSAVETFLAFIGGNSIDFWVWSALNIWKSDKI